MSNSAQSTFGPAGPIGATGATGATGVTGVTGATGAGFANIQAASTTGSSAVTSTTYAAYPTNAGPAVTVTIGASGIAIVIVGARLDSGPTSNAAYYGFAISGASTVAASDTFAAKNAAGVTPECERTFVVTGLAAGSTTFTSQGRVTGGTGTCSNRNITVIPL